MKIAYLLLAFERTPDALALLDRYPTATRLLETLASAGHEATLLGRFHRDEEVKRGGARFLFRADDPERLLPGPFTNPAKLWRLLRGLEVDVVHANGLLFPIHAALARRAAGRRAALVVQHHGGGPGGLLRRAAQRLFLGAADGFLFTAAGIAEPWRRGGLIRADAPIHEVVEASSDFAPVPREAARAQTNVSGDPAILWVGRLHPRKDPLTALRGFRRALGRLPNARLQMAFGDAPLLGDVKRFLADEGIADRVRLVGAVPHAALPAWYSAADLFLTSGPDEGSNYALIEALACGLFPAASDIPAHRALTSDGAHGELFSVGDAEGCAEALVRAAARVAAGGAALRASTRRYFDDALSWRAVGEQAVAAYAAAVARRAARRD